MAWVSRGAACILGGGAALEFFVDPILGRASDMYGRKLVVNYSVLGLLFQLSIVAIWPSKTAFILMAVARGLTSGFTAMLYAMVRDLWVADAMGVSRWVARSFPAHPTPPPPARHI